MKKKILFFHTAHPRLNLIGQIQLEIIAGHLSNSDEVFILPSNFNLVSSQTNHIDPNYNFYHYKNLCDKTFKLLASVGNFSVLDYVTKEKMQLDIDNITNIQELKSYHYKNINIGMGVASSLISLIRDHEFCVQDYKSEIIEELDNACIIIDNLEKLYLEIKPNLVYVFNGRMSTYSPVVHFCQQNNIDFRVFEFTSRYDKYHVLEAAIPHDIYYREKEMRNAWLENPNLDYKIQVAKDFFEAQKNGITLMDGTFSSTSIKEFQKEDIGNKEIITFFNSSIDEFASVPGWKKYIYIYDNEVEAIRDICVFFENDNRKQFVLRIHPNLKFLNNTQTKALLTLRDQKNLIIIEPTSEISSYNLMNASSKVITFGSTLGIEACYFEKVSILLGMSFYDNLDVSYIPDCREKLMELINTHSLKPKPLVNAYLYGYWWMSFGEKFTYKIKGLYTPQKLDPNTLEVIIGFGLKIFRINFWKRSLKIFDRDLLKKMKNPNYRLAILREFIPWIKK